VADSPHTYQPVEVTVKPGATVEWAIEKDASVRLTSGFPPTSDHGSSAKEGAHGEHEEQEKTLVAIEVRP
jgi:plastocyanin